MVLEYHGFGKRATMAFWNWIDIAYGWKEGIE